MKIAAAGGGTGGHLYPALAVLESIVKIKDIDVVYFCVARGLENKIIPLEHPEYKRVVVDIMGLKRPIINPVNIKRLLKIAKIKSMISSETKECDFGFLTGGYVSFPVGKALLSQHKPIFIQEQNIVPGLTNKVLSKNARKIFVGFEETVRYFPRSVRKNVIVTGNPIRIKENDEWNEAKDFVLVMGGSKGSEFLNSIMEQIYSIDHETTFVHITGDSNWTKRLSKFKNVLAYDYIYSMASVWRRARLVIARAGALTVSEMLYFGVPGVLIPWEGSAGRHQVKNAMYLEKTGRAVVLRQKDCNRDNLLAALKKAQRLQRQEEKKDNPATQIAKIILEEIL
ncbi:UDP-N-acetylglucosamine--N-acetylmuramyl-(pentapeptide) pyrophosphoryl-undecaprenol N-acetylglucosamine transferase [Pseudothermotoga thermarum]|uniref:UDP-N-acetylglucosamine--N-acetylmuramyl-(pentapeptide) pyrophosphoryl-undecaprenol N-acetylglucosamine transferase n=1 Tax=Pseudothermotoga thermarum DSM 5069 TaxID=688269 RepID=F7YXX3_9THEM|nr:UDP-N-acetylglucosamine--N-acetylmuramyl-(pentapeptide) pyrophosphoryl-undecaprenol N-acetylglucosamine transferase [Pseudothermotoga thermarum]AEH50772.1 Undecaprenyldiphospho-muramoylpentapeptide beta-N-acetylglucosaminyltransferase [Pseudothermotoga thermarum DSM 5069]